MTSPVTVDVTSSPRLPQARLSSTMPPPDPLDDLLGRIDNWKFIGVCNQTNPGFMPPLGYSLDDGSALFFPIRKTATNAGNVLAVAAPMGTGKSTMVRGFQECILTGRSVLDRIAVQVEYNPSARFLLLTANRMYASCAAREQHTLVCELQARGFTVGVSGCYLDSKVLAACQIVLCSFESLHLVEGQRFEYVILDEVGSLARLVGGGTMVGFGNVFLLRLLCSYMGTSVLALDADLLFKMDPSEPRSVVADFLNLIAPEREVVCAKLVGLKPANLERSARFFFDHKACEGENGLTEWFQRIDNRASEWHRTKGASGLTIIFVGTKKFGRTVCRRVISHESPFQFLHGDSDAKKRREILSNPGAYFPKLAFVIMTTVYCQGCNLPQDITVASVFAAFFRVGCTLQHLCQSFMRARKIECQEFFVLLDCVPPNAHSRLVSAGKLKAIVHPTYDESLKVVTKQRSSGMRYYEHELAAGGGLPAGIGRLNLLEDNVLRVIAHARFERCMQFSDLFYAASQLFKHHGWGVSLGTLEQTMAAVDLSTLSKLVLSEDQKFDIKMSDKQKWQLVVEHIFQNGEDAFISNQCYGLATKEMAASDTLGAFYQLLVKAWWAFRHIGYVPGFDTPVGDADGEGVADGEGDAASTSCLGYSDAAPLKSACEERGIACF